MGNDMYVTPESILASASCNADLHTRGADIRAHVFIVSNGDGTFFVTSVQF